MYLEENSQKMTLRFIQLSGKSDKSIYSTELIWNTFYSFIY